MFSRGWVVCLGALVSLVLDAGCATLLGDNVAREPEVALPESYGTAQEDQGASVLAQSHWDELFADPHLRSLIEMALSHNRELAIRFQEIIIANAEVGAARGEYLPRLDFRAGAGLEKVGQHTSQGVGDESHGVPEHLADFRFGLVTSWEVDVWGRLRDAKEAANYRYLASVEATNFFITELVAEVANSYWELVALDEQLKILRANIELQQGTLEAVKAKKAAGRGTELEVQRLSGEVLKSQALIYEIERQRVLGENRINFLVGRFPQEVPRDNEAFMAPVPQVARTGLPSELLDNRPDVREAASLMEASKLDTQAAKARFYPSLSIEAGVGYQAFNALHLLVTPQSLAYNLVGNLVAPLLNRAAIAAEYQAANARQFQAVYNYERTLIGAFTEVVNELASVGKLASRHERLSEQVDVLQDAIETSNVLYQSARADYMDVLLTRRDALEAQLELVETKRQQRQALVSLYKSLGGGWRRKGEGNG